MMTIYTDMIIIITPHSIVALINPAKNIPVKAPPLSSHKFSTVLLIGVKICPLTFKVAFIP